MISDLRELAYFVETGKTPSALAGIEAAVGSQPLRVVAIKLLGWLKSRAKNTAERPLELRDDFPWCMNLRTVLSSSPQLSQTFEIQGNELNFSPTVSQSDRQEIEEFIDQHFQPRLMT